MLGSTDPDRHIFVLSEKKNGQILTNFNSFIPILLKIFFLGMSEGKIKIKAGRLLFLLVGHNFFMSKDSLTVKYTESGLMNIIY